MLHIYPSNHLEDLATLLDELLAMPMQSVLGTETLLVQNAGMEHWLKLQLAERRGIAMNLDFQLPASWFWSLIRRLLPDHKLPELSPYSREVMTWRLYALLGNPAIIAHPQCNEATHYWRTDAAEDNRKRFQLSLLLADLYEQYLIFRPQWIDAWDGGESNHWQALLWQKLCADIPGHPLQLLRMAQRQLPKATAVLPARLFIFGINSMPPLWLEFLDTLGKHIELHLFQLNPCVKYWGDAHSEKYLQTWMQTPEDSFEINPLLGNLGKQGRDFLLLLQDLHSSEFSVFRPPAASSESITVLQQLQTDIFELRDARRTPCERIDSSITLVSAHSALREVQALHDWLLHRFNQDPELKPADILVTCPQIEDYAAAAQSVFNGENGALPCSLSDRSLNSSEPLVTAFMQLLELPDSRFQVSAIIDLLHLPEVQQRFALQEQDLPLLEHWLDHAAVHWGLNARHKARILGQDQASACFTWEQGLQRLLLGFSWGPKKQIHDGLQLLPDVEGEEALLLGQLLEFISQLRRYAQILHRAHPAGDWAQWLSSLCATLFVATPEQQSSLQLLHEGIQSLQQHAELAGSAQELLPLGVVRDFLGAAFARPEPGHQYLVGQVTFCSMLPMRSIPFKIIAVLGLNDGDFPRQRVPLGFDLMAAESPRRGDRSRAADDRYLFLETLISARERLYLSYQGADIKTGQPQEPSLLLKELMEYLQQGYGWNFSGDSPRPLHQLPMQPFSPQNYRQGQPFQSFDRGWLQLRSAAPPQGNLLQLPAEPPTDEPLPLESLLSFFNHPPQQFAQQRLGLYLGQLQTPVLQDQEPFDSSHLDQYLLQQDLVECFLQNNDPRALLDHARLSGQLPDLPSTASKLEEWTKEAEAFATVIRQLGGDGRQWCATQVVIDNQIVLGRLPSTGQSMLFHRLAKPKGKDYLRLWLHHLLANCATDTVPRVTQGIYRSDKKNAACQLITLQPLDNAQQQLAELLRLHQLGLQRPLLLGVDLGWLLKDGAAWSTEAFTAHWEGSDYRPGLGNDPYYQWFWPQIPSLDSAGIAALESVYEPMWAQMEVTQC